MTFERRTICAVTGSRADFGLLRPALAALAAEPSFDLKLVVTGQHLAPSQDSGGSMLQEVIVAAVADGYAIDARAPVLEAGGADDPADASLALARGASAFTTIFQDLRPDLLLLLGDRYEILAPASVALLFNIPIAHLCGGDVTEGAYDDAIRHAISKMAYLHFPTNVDAQRRLVKMGEDPARVFAIGSTGLDAIRKAELVDRKSLLYEIGAPDLGRLFAITYHPETAGVAPAAVHEVQKRRIEALLMSLDAFPDATIVFTGVNADTGWRVIADSINSFIQTRSSAVSVQSLGSRRYLSLLAAADVVIGNSSSGLYEAPSFGVPTVNIGDRQKGRLRAASVLDCASDTASIRETIRSALTRGRVNVDNPYGDGHASARLVEALKSAAWRAGESRKAFFDGLQNEQLGGRRFGERHA